MWVFPKKMGKTPNHPIFNRVWNHYKPSILGGFPLFLETSMYFSSVLVASSLTLIWPDTVYICVFQRYYLDRCLVPVICDSRESATSGWQDPEPTKHHTSWALQEVTTGCTSAKQLRKHHALSYASTQKLGFSICWRMTSIHVSESSMARSGHDFFLLPRWFVLENCKNSCVSGFSRFMKKTVQFEFRVISNSKISQIWRFSKTCFRFIGWMGEKNSELGVLSPK